MENKIIYVLNDVFKNTKLQLSIMCLMACNVLIQPTIALLCYRRIKFTRKNKSIGSYSTIGQLILEILMLTGFVLGIFNFLGLCEIAYYQYSYESYADF